MNWPTGLDLGTDDGIEMELLSQAIYEKVLKAFNAENEPPQNFGAVSSSSSSSGSGGGRGQRSSVDEENGSRTDIIRVKSEEEEIVIGDVVEEEEEEKVAGNIIHGNVQTVNRGASADGRVNSDQEQGKLEETVEEAMGYNNVPQKVNLFKRPRKDPAHHNKSSTPRQDKTRG